MGAFAQKELEYLKEQELGRIATVSKKRLPQVTPIVFGVDEDKLYVNIKHTSKKARNIRHNPNISLVVDDASSWGAEDEWLRGVLISGEAELISSGGLHEKGRELIEEKHPGYEEKFGIREDGWSKYILVITPTKVQSWGLT
jgi:pyridoxamine 5'-phosphate oxidase family protein